MQRPGVSTDSLVKKKLRLEPMVKSIPTSNKFYALYQDDETSLSDGASETEGQRWEPLRPKKKIVKKAKVVPKKVEIPAVEADTPEPEEKGY